MEVKLRGVENNGKGRFEEGVQVLFSSEMGGLTSVPSLIWCPL